MKNCKKIVHHGYLGLGTSPCSKSAWKEGFCKIHHPDSVKARRDKQAKKFQDSRALQMKAWKRAEASESLVNIISQAAEKDELFTSQNLRTAAYRLAKIAKGEKP